MGFLIWGLKILNSVLTNLNNAPPVIALPDGDADVVKKGELPPIQNELWEKFKIEVPVMPWPDAGKRLVRISAQVYNSLPQYEYLAEALAKLLAR